MKKIKDKNSFLIATVSCIVLLLTMCYLGVNTSMKGTSAALESDFSETIIDGSSSGSSTSSATCPSGYTEGTVTLDGVTYCLDEYVDEMVLNSSNEAVCKVNEWTHFINHEVSILEDRGYSCTQTGSSAGGYPIYSCTGSYSACAVILGDSSSSSNTGSTSSKTCSSGQTLVDDTYCCPDDRSDAVVSDGGVNYCVSTYNDENGTPYYSASHEACRVDFADGAQWLEQYESFEDIGYMCPTGNVFYCYLCKASNATCTVSVDTSCGTVAVAAAESYTVTFNGNGGTPSSSSLTGTSITLPSATRSGYTLKGWYTAASGGTKIGSVGDSYTPTAAITLYAQWTVNTYTVSYITKDGSGGPASQTKTHGTDLVLSATAPTKTGYEFQGWATSATSSTVAYKPGDTYSEDKSITLYAVWKANEYTISYNASGGDGAPSAQTKKHDTAITLSTTKPTRNGYEFQGWNTVDSTGNTGVTYQPGASYYGNSNITLYAVWKQSTYEYTATFNANNGTLNGSSTLKCTSSVSNQCTLESAYHTIPTATRTGYTFKGWGESASCTSGLTDNIVMTTSTKTYYACWTANTYTVSYNANGGSGAPSSQTKTHDKALTLSSTKPTRSGYTFLGWATSSTATVATYQASGSYTNNASATLYAVWSVDTPATKTFSATFNANNGTLNGSSSLSCNTTSSSCEITGLPTATRAGYNFKGWGTSSSCTSGSTDKLTLSANTTYYACWTATTYTVSYNANGGSGAPSSQTKTHGTDLVLSTTAPTRSGYIFLGWATSSTATTAAYKAGGKYTDNKAITLYAVWEKEVAETVKYTGTFMNGSSKFSETTCSVAEGKTACNMPVPNTTPTKTGYTFVGWSTSTACAAYQKTPFADVSKNTTYYACYTKNETTTTPDTDVDTDKDNNNDNIDNDGNATDNPQTGQIAVAITWFIGILAMAYSFYYFRKVKED